MAGGAGPSSRFHSAKARTFVRAFAFIDLFMVTMRPSGRGIIRRKLPWIRSEDGWFRVGVRPDTRNRGFPAKTGPARFGSELGYFRNRAAFEARTEAVIRWRI